MKEYLYHHEKYGRPTNCNDDQIMATWESITGVGITFSELEKLIAKRVQEINQSSKPFAH